MQEEKVVLNSILRAALAASDPKQAVHSALIPKGSHLFVGGRDYNLDAYRNIYVMSVGKAAIPMAEAIEEILGDRITDGIVISSYSVQDFLKHLSMVQASHPIPDKKGMKAAERCIELAKKANQDDLVFVLLSGGASALLPLPVSRITLRDKQRVTQGLLKSGARINEINIVRKHLSRIKGGRLAAEIHPASCLTMILSDVLTGEISAIASGPTAPDSSTFDEAIDILKRYKIWNRLPGSVKRHLTKGCRGRYPETPKPGDPIFERIHHCIVSDNRKAVQAAVHQARALGFQAMTLTTTLQGEAREAGRFFGALAREINQSGQPISRPVCLLAGGELTVTVRGRGRGGRAQEFALAASVEIEHLPRTLVVGFGTDGLDGPTSAAGAVVDGTTVERARMAGWEPQKALLNNNAYAFFKDLGDLLITGPTGTNVNDLYLLLMPFVSDFTGGKSL